MSANLNKAMFTKLINGSLVQVQLGEPHWTNPNPLGGSDLFVFYPGRPVFGLVVRL